MLLADAAPGRAAATIDAQSAPSVRTRVREVMPPACGCQIATTLQTPRPGRSCDRLHRMSALPQRIGVVGAGTMGAGIAQLGVQAGLETWLQDPDPQALA